MRSRAVSVNELSLADDPKQALIDGVGDLKDFKLFSGRVLVGIYVASAKTKGGIIRPEMNVSEDIWQGTVGLVLKLGPLAFKDDEVNKFQGQSLHEGDWVLIRPGDTIRLQVNGINCRIIEDTLIQMVVPDPERITHYNI